tara:strand:- start:90 stop:650 length:561 start_codon:yes stop_codon:yes gene_type:complete
MTKARGKDLLGPMTSVEAANRFSEVSGHDMSALLIEPSLDLMCQWGLGDRIDDQHADATYVFDWDRIDHYYDQNWNNKAGLIYKIRAVGPQFLDQALMRTEEAAVNAFNQGERPGRLVEHSRAEAEQEQTRSYPKLPELQKFETAKNHQATPDSDDEQIDWQKFGVIAAIIIAIVTICAMFYLDKN